MSTAIKNLILNTTYQVPVFMLIFKDCLAKSLSYTAFEAGLFIITGIIHCGIKLAFQNYLNTDVDSSLLSLLI